MNIKVFKKIFCSLALFAIVQFCFHIANADAINDNSNKMPNLPGLNSKLPLPEINKDKKVENKVDEKIETKDDKKEENKTIETIKQDNEQDNINKEQPKDEIKQKDVEIKDDNNADIKENVKTDNLKEDNIKNTVEAKKEENIEKKETTSDDNNTIVKTEDVKKENVEEKQTISSDTLKKLEGKIIEQSEKQDKQDVNDIKEAIIQQKQDVVKEVIQEEQKEELNKNTENQKDKTLDKKTDKGEKTNDNDLNFEKLFTIFDKKKALNFDYNKIGFNNFSLLENAEELKEIKKAIKLQLNDGDKKNVQETKKTISANISYGKIENDLRIYSLVYLNDKDWKARVNRENVSYKNKDSKNFNGAMIVKSNKTSMIFLLLTPNKMVETVKKIKEENASYSKNYYLVREGKDTYIAFKLFIGQTINLDTMKIKG